MSTLPNIRIYLPEHFKDANGFYHNFKLEGEMRRENGNNSVQDLRYSSNRLAEKVAKLNEKRGQRVLIRELKFSTVYEFHPIETPESMKTSESFQVEKRQRK